MISPGMARRGIPAGGWLSDLPDLGSQFAGPLGCVFQVLGNRGIPLGQSLAVVITLNRSIGSAVPGGVWFPDVVGAWGMSPPPGDSLGLFYHDPDTSLDLGTSCPSPVVRSAELVVSDLQIERSLVAGEHYLVPWFE